MKVFSFPSGCRYKRFFFQTGSGGSTVSHDFNFLLLDITADADLKGIIRTFPSPYGKENNCLHVGLSGAAFSLPVGSPVYSANSDIRGPLIGADSYTFGTPIPWGIDYDLDFIPSRYAGTHQRVWKTVRFQGDVMTISSMGSYVYNTYNYRNSWYYTMTFDRTTSRVFTTGKGTLSSRIFNTSSYEEMATSMGGYNYSVPGGVAFQGGTLAGGSVPLKIDCDSLLASCKPIPRTDHFLSVVPKSIGSDLTYAAVQQVQTASVNGLALISDLRNLGDLIPKFTKVMGNFSKKTLKSVAKASSSVALEYFYGMRLTISDLKIVLDGIYTYVQANNLSRRRSASTGFMIDGLGYQAHLGVYIPPLSTNFMKFRAMLADFDFEVTPSNVWDLVPYSFVVDWVLPVQDFLQRLELGAKIGSGRMQILYTIGSYKTSAYPSISSGICGVVVTVYRRDVFAMPPEMKLLASSGKTKPFDHIVEGMSLLVQGIL